MKPAKLLQIITASCAFALTVVLRAQDSTDQQAVQATPGADDPVTKYTAQIAANPPDSDKATLYFLRGRVYKDNRDYDKAIADFNDAIRINPKYGYAFTLRGDCYMDKGNFEQALSDFDNVISLEPKNFKVMANRGIVHEQMGDYEKAIDSYSESIDVNPHFAPVRTRRAWDYLVTGNPDSALADCNEAIRADPNYAEAYGMRGQVYVRLNQADNAKADLDKAIALDPKNPHAYAGRGNMLSAAGDYAGAKTDFTRSVELGPKSAYSLNQLAWLLSVCPLADVRDGKKAVEYAQQACELTQWKMPSYIDTLAAAYAEAGDFDNAVKFEQQFVKTPGLGQDDVDRANGIISLYKDHKPYREGQ